MLYIYLFYAKKRVINQKFNLHLLLFGIITINVIMMVRPINLCNNKILQSYVKLLNNYDDYVNKQVIVCVTLNMHV